MSDGVLLAHGVGSREDLPIPFSYALIGAAAALLISFLAVGLLWREPRLDPKRAGRPLPRRVAAVLDSPALRATMLGVGLVAAGYVALAAVFGKDDALDPTPGVVYVLLWVGVPLLSVVLGPVWRMVNPIRGAHAGLAAVMHANPAEGLATYPRRLGYWPAALSLFAFTWLELVPADNTTLPVLRTFLALYIAVNLLAATFWGNRWFGRGDALEVYSSLLGRLSVLGRRGDRRLVLRNPLAGVAGTPIAPGLFAVVGVLLGSTAYDSASSSPWWVSRVQTSSWSPALIETLGLTASVVLVTGAFVAAAALSGVGTRLPVRRLVGEFSHTLVPIVAGYVIAHYWSLLVLFGQQTLIQLSDPLGTGANWLGTGNRAIEPALADPTFTAVLQVCAVIAGHVLGVVLAHDRAIRLLPRSRAVVGQLPMLALMLVYTVGGLTLLFAA